MGAVGCVPARVRPGIAEARVDDIMRPRLEDEAREARRFADLDAAAERRPLGYS